MFDKLFFKIQQREINKEKHNRNTSFTYARTGMKIDLCANNIAK